MRVFVAGATGAIGSRLVPTLVEAGHEVTGTTRSSEKVQRIRGMGADGVVMDGLDTEGVRRAVRHARPEVVVREMTDPAGFTDFRRFEEGFATTNRLRTEGRTTCSRARARREPGGSSRRVTRPGRTRARAAG